MVHDPTTKLERALAAHLLLQGKAPTEETFIASDTRERVLPNRTIQVISFTPVKGHRLEGVCEVQIVHHFPSAKQEGQTDYTARIARGQYLSATIESLTFGHGDAMPQVADAITSAGRWLAQTDGTTEGDQQAAENADMLDFRCDWLELASPFITRGNTEEGTAWVEILHFRAGTSTASTSN